MLKPRTSPRGVTIVPGGGVTTPRGFVAGAAFAGIKTLGKDPLDVGILASERPCKAVAMFTRSTVPACAVLVSKDHVRSGSVQAVVVNSGCSNVATGARGMRDAVELSEITADMLAIRPSAVLVGSTGVIGRYLPMEKIRKGLANIALSTDGGHAFARANMTTDTFAKEIAVRFRAAGIEYAIGACAKGSGMIHPDMNTMFCWVTTDAPVDGVFLRSSFRVAIGDSLNMISVDGDTSTSDTSAILANGTAGGRVITRDGPGGATFEAALRYVTAEIARMLARDGEGASKLIEMRIERAATDVEARRAARTVTVSPLVKSAVHGADPNWGRLLMAIGRSGARINVDRARAWIGDIPVFRGVPLDFDERAASRYLKNEEVVLRVDLGVGKATATAWGCDLTQEYVHINSDYTT